MTHPQRRDPAKFERQLRLEEEMVGMGIAKFRADVQKAREAGVEEETHGGMKIMRAAFEPLQAHLEEWKNHHSSGALGRTPVAYTYLKEIPTDVLAFLTLKVVVSSISKNVSLQKVTSHIAEAIQIEQNMKTFKRQSTNHYKKVRADVLKRSRNTKHIVGVLRSSARKDEITLESYTPSEKHQIGSFLLGACITSTGLVKLVKPPKKAGEKKNEMDMVVPTEKTTEWLRGHNARCELLSPVLLPMLVEPKDWKKPVGGGFWTSSIKIPLVRTPDYRSQDELYNVDMWEVYQAINHAQKTRWKVNKRVLEVMTRAVDNNIRLGGLPSGEEAPLPPRPHDIDTNKESRWVWKKKATLVYGENERQRSKYISLNKVLHIADKYKDEEEFYYVYNFCFRGRIYPVQSGLQPQGDDTAKSLLCFAKGKPLDDETGAWFAVHGANLYGYDKVSLQDRVEWVKENTAKIIEAAEDPFNNQWWTEADKPWQFLGFCFEWADFQKDPVNFLCHTPPAMDGSCNGLQNFSAMLRDPIGGKATNLLPSDTPQDIYMEVAKVVEEKLEIDIAKGITEAIPWKGYVSRKLVKRPTMTMPYGATLTGYREQLMDEVKSWEDSGKDVPSFSENNFKEFMYMAQLISDSLGEVVVAAKVAMEWLQKVATIIAKENLPIYWSTPVGFPVLQNYKNILTRAVRTEIAGNFHFNKVAYKEGTKINTRRMSAGIAPNFVHSCDAAHLVRTINLCEANGIQDLALVHDSFGTHAADLPAFNLIIRHAFKQIHEAEPLQLFYEAICEQCSDPSTVPPPPSKGSLDLSKILEAEYFFA